MAKLLCINANTYREGINEIGDIVDIKPDSYEPGPAEAFGFDIKQVPGTVEEFAAEQKKQIAAIKPKDMTQDEEQEWDSSVKFPMRIKDDKAAKLSDAIECKMPRTKPVLSIQG